MRNAKTLLFHHMLSESQILLQLIQNVEHFPEIIQGSKVFDLVSLTRVNKTVSYRHGLCPSLFPEDVESQPVPRLLIKSHRSHRINRHEFSIFNSIRVRLKYIISPLYFPALPFEKKPLVPSSPLTYQLRNSMHQARPIRIPVRSSPPQSGKKRNVEWIKSYKLDQIKSLSSPDEKEERILER